MGIKKNFELITHDEDDVDSLKAMKALLMELVRDLEDKGKSVIVGGGSFDHVSGKVMYHYVSNNRVPIELFQEFTDYVAERGISMVLELKRKKK